jgi:hypothetical protein
MEKKTCRITDLAWLFPYGFAATPVMLEPHMAARSKYTPPLPFQQSFSIKERK